MRIGLYVQFTGNTAMKLHYLVLSVGVSATILFSGCTTSDEVRLVESDVEVEMHASNPDDVVLAAGQPQFVEFFSFY